MLDKRAIPSLYFFKRLQVASSPLTVAITISPSSASDCWRTITTSFSHILGSIEFPFNFKPKKEPVLDNSSVISSVSIISSIASTGMPAATRPRTGILIPCVLLLSLSTILSSNQ